MMRTRCSRLNTQELHSRRSAQIHLKTQRDARRGADSVLCEGFYREGFALFDLAPTSSRRSTGHLRSRTIAAQTCFVNPPRLGISDSSAVVGRDCVSPPSVAGGTAGQAASGTQSTHAPAPSPAPTPSRSWRPPRHTPRSLRSKSRLGDPTYLFAFFVSFALKSGLSARRANPPRRADLPPSATFASHSALFAFKESARRSDVPQKVSSESRRTLHTVAD